MGIERLEDFVVLFLSTLHHRQDTTANAEVEAGAEVGSKSGGGRGREGGEERGRDIISSDKISKNLCEVQKKSVG